MTFERAIRILELKNDFTEEELKKSYRRLIVKWHPDKCKDKRIAEEKTKDLNLARDFLLRYAVDKKDNSYSYSKNYTRDIVHKVVADLSKSLYDMFLGNKNYDNLVGDIKNIYNIIKNNIDEFVNKTVNMYDNDVDEINSLFLLYKYKINTIIMKYAEGYCIRKKYKYKINHNFFLNNMKIVIEDDYVINSFSTLYSVYSILSSVIIKKSDYEILVDSYVDKFKEQYLKNVMPNYNYDVVTNKYINIINNLIKEFKDKSLESENQNRINDLFAEYNYMIRFKRAEFAIKYCESEYIPFGECNNDYIMVYGFMVNLNKDIIELRKMIHFIKTDYMVFGNINKNIKDNDIIGISKSVNEVKESINNNFVLKKKK